MNEVIVFILAFAAVFCVLRFPKRKMRLKSPRLGMLDLSSGTADAIVHEDRAALQDLFVSCEESRDAVPKCDVLFLYAQLGEGGALQGSERYLRATIRDSEAKIVVVASENPSPKPNRGKPVYGKANIVITLHRNGPKFPRFMRELFSRMKSGQTMPMAWVRLVPQGPSPKHDDCPATIFLMEVGPIVFK